MSKTWFTGRLHEYQYNGKEFEDDLGLMWYDYGSRWYDPSIGRWSAVDPHSAKYAPVTPYNYVYNTPINGIDEGGRDGILLVWPDYMVRVGKRRIPHLGHAGVLLIDNKTGLTKYYEFGRYDNEGLGVVQHYKVPDVILDSEGNPTKKSLDKVLKFISSKSGQGGRIKGAYVKSDNFDAMNDYAQDQLRQNSNPARRPYSLTKNNCATFGCDVLSQDPNVNAPWILDPRPNSIIDEWIDDFHRVDWVPEIPMPKPEPKPEPKPDPKPKPKPDPKPDQNRA